MRWRWLKKLIKQKKIVPFMTVGLKQGHWSKISGVCWHLWESAGTNNNIGVTWLSEQQPAILLFRWQLCLSWAVLLFFCLRRHLSCDSGFITFIIGMPLVFAVRQVPVTWTFRPGSSIKVSLSLATLSITGSRFWLEFPPNYGVRKM